METDDAFQKGGKTVTYLSQQYFTIVLDLTFWRSQGSLRSWGDISAGP